MVSTYIHRVDHERHYGWAREIKTLLSNAQCGRRFLGPIYAGREAVETTIHQIIILQLDLLTSRCGSRVLPGSRNKHAPRPALVRHLAKGSFWPFNEKQIWMESEKRVRLPLSSAYQSMRLPSTQGSFQHFVFPFPFYQNKRRAVSRGLND
jgi:hypothetical protein